jgi:hypothetical protein
VTLGVAFFRQSIPFYFKWISMRPIFLILIAAVTCYSGPAQNLPLPPTSPIAPGDSFPVPLLDGGGLYGGGSDDPPPQHIEAGLAAAAAVPDSGALFVPLGMSTTLHIWEAWSRVLTSSLMYSPGTACGGCVANKWDRPMDAGWRTAVENLSINGYTGADVDVVWMNVLASQTTPPTVQDLEEILVQIRQYYPNAKQIFVSSYPYGGYRVKGSAEPGAWESGLAARQFILSHLGESDPWIGWGPYLWANGSEPRSDGLVWLREDYRADGLHLSDQGLSKAAGILDSWFRSSPLTNWYR